MKKSFVLATILLICAVYGFAASPITGTWNCIASVDQDYPFVLTITEDNGNLAAKAESTSGEVGPVENISFENGNLTFSIDTAIAGMVDFKAVVEGDTLEGTLEGWDFGGQFKGTRKK